MSRLEKTEPVKAIQEASPNSRQPGWNEWGGRTNAGSHADIDEAGKCERSQFHNVQNIRLRCGYPLYSISGETLCLRTLPLPRRMVRTLSWILVLTFGQNLTFLNNLHILRRKDKENSFRTLKKKKEHFIIAIEWFFFFNTFLKPQIFDFIGWMLKEWGRKRPISLFSRGRYPFLMRRPLWEIVFPCLGKLISNEELASADENFESLENNYEEHLTSAMMKTNEMSSVE